MKISQLIEVLKRRLEKHGDRDVEVTWESTTRSIDPDNIYLSSDGLLYIDADGNFYKGRFAVDPTEGDDVI